MNEWMKDSADAYEQCRCIWDILTNLLVTSVLLSEYELWYKRQDNMQKL